MEAEARKGNVSSHSEARTKITSVEEIQVVIQLL